MGRDATRTDLVFLAANNETRGSFVDDEEVDLAALVVLTSLGGHENEVGHAGIGAPDLRPVEAEAVAVALGAGLDAGHVGTALRLGQRQRAAQVARGKAGQIFLLLLRTAACENGADRDPLHHEKIGRVVADAPELLDGDTGGEHASVPPYSAGNGRVKSPSSLIKANMSCGYSAVRSISCARAATFSRATRRTRS